MARARLVLAGLAGAGFVVASVAVPVAQAVPGPGILDVAVPVVLIGCAILLADRGRRLTAGLLGTAGVLWCLVGLTTVLPDLLAAGLLRLGLVPLALVVVAVSCLPAGALRGAWGSTALALSVAAAGGAGVPLPVRLSLGVVPVGVALYAVRGAGLAALFRSRLGLAAVLLQAGLGTMLIAADPAVSSAVLRPEWAAGAVDVAVAASAVGALWILDPERLVWGSEKSFEVRGDRLGVETWLADLLRAPCLRVAYPDAVGGCVLEDGSPWGPPTGPSLATHEGEVVAWFDRDVAIDPVLRSRLVQLVSTVGASARLRAAQVERSAELDRSRARLAESALFERVALEARLAQALLPLLAAIESRVGLLPAPESVSARLDAARDQVRAVLRGLTPLGDRSLEEALGDLAALAPDRVTVDAVALAASPQSRMPDFSEATVMWFAAAEAVTNALKHAPGSPVLVRAVSPCLVHIRDSGGGGAEPAGSGLAGIRDRVAAVGGRVDVRSGPDGTQVSVSVPGRHTGWPVCPSRAGHDAGDPRGYLRSVT